MTKFVLLNFACRLTKTTLTLFVRPTQYECLVSTLYRNDHDYKYCLQIAYKLYNKSTYNFHAQSFYFPLKPNVRCPIFAVVLLLLFPIKL